MCCNRKYRQGDSSEIFWYGNGCHQVCSEAELNNWFFIMKSQVEQKDEKESGSSYLNNCQDGKGDCITYRPVILSVTMASAVLESRSRDWRRDASDGDACLFSLREFALNRWIWDHQQRRLIQSRLEAVEREAEE